MWFFTVWFKSKDPYWDGVWNYIILACETNIGLICACLPCCKPLLVRLFPCIFSNHESRASDRNNNNDPAGPSPLDPEAQRIRNKRSWSFWGTGTGTTLTTTTTTTSSSNAPGGNTRRSVNAPTPNAAAGKSDTVILMDDLGNNTGLAPTDYDEYDSITASHEADRSLTVTPQPMNGSLTDVSSARRDIELGFPPPEYEYIAVSEDGHPGRKIMP